MLKKIGISTIYFRSLFSLLGLLFVMDLALLGQVTNDFPCDALFLNVNTNCSFSRFSNLDATDSGNPLTECDGYMGGDIWFKAVVPLSGMLRIEINSEATAQFPNNDGWSYRPGLAIYRGGCSTLVFDTCWIDQNVVGIPIKPDILLTGKTPGETLFLRVWEHSDNDKGLFDICIYDSTELPELIIPEAFSPNEDGYNDKFEIVGINFYPENELRIFNVHGVEVYNKAGYENSWDGKSNSKMNSGSILPEGTYFYILYIGSKLPVKGTLYLRRE